MFDCDIECTISVHLFATETYQSGRLAYECSCARLNITTNSRTPSSSSSCVCIRGSTRTYERGASHTYHHDVSRAIVPGRYSAKVWELNLNDDYFPVAIECRPVDPKLKDSHAHVTLAYLEKSLTAAVSSSSRPVSQDVEAMPIPMSHTTTYQIKPVKQKQLINGVLFCIQEVYGIERKNTLSSSPTPPNEQSMASSNSENDEHAAGVSCDRTSVTQSFYSLIFHNQSFSN